MHFEFSNFFFSALACYYESRLTDGSMGRYLFGEQDDEAEPDRINQWYARILRRCWTKNPQFLALKRRTAGEVGTHSIRKKGSTMAARHGAMVAMIECRGRWKGPSGNRVVNRSYISPEQEATDAKVAGMLCVGGPVKYKLKYYAGVSRQFIREVVMPKTFEFFRDDESSKSDRSCFCFCKKALTNCLLSLSSSFYR